jgi:nitrate reductase assembly molybdenum cofactor insertion protein NarJ
MLGHLEPRRHNLPDLLPLMSENLALEKRTVAVAALMRPVFDDTVGVCRKPQR